MNDLDIKSIRESLGENQTDFGKRLGVNRNTVAEYEKTGNIPANKLGILQEIAKSMHKNVHIKPLSSIKDTMLKYLKGMRIELNEFYSATNIKEGLLTNDEGLSDTDFLSIVTYMADYENRLKSISVDEPETVKENHRKVFKLRTDRIIDEQAIPLYNLEATAGIVTLFKDSKEFTPIDYLHIPNLPKCDGALYVTGDSMYPLLKSGDIVAYKQIQDFVNDIFWGEMYLVSVDIGGEEMVTIKYVQKSEKEGYIKLVSQNKHHQDKEIQMSKLRAMAIVKASVRINSMS